MYKRQCIGGVVVLTAGLFTYIHIADTNTLGRKISIYGMDVSTLTADKAEQKLLDAFRSRKVQFKEGGSDVYQTTVSELGYDLDESALKSELTELQTDVYKRQDVCILTLRSQDLLLYRLT